MIRTVRASGKDLYASNDVEEGSNLKGMVPSRPVVLVATHETSCVSRSGMRKVLVQPAPSISRSTDSALLAGVDEDAAGTDRVTILSMELGQRCTVVERRHEANIRVSICPDTRYSQ